MKKIFKYILTFIAIFLMLNKVYAYNDYAVLEEGPNVNTILKTLAQNENVTVNLIDENVTKIIRSSTNPYDENIQNVELISSSDSPMPIYAWYDNGIIYYYSESATIYLKSNSSNIFNLFGVVEEIDLTGFDTSNVNNLWNMFNGCSNLKNIDVSSFDTSKVTNMSGLFSGCSSLTELNLNNFNTFKVTNMSSMFADCTSLTTLNIDNFETSNVTSMERMFKGCSSLENINTFGFDTSNVTTMDSMFNGCSSLTSIDIGTFNTSKVTDMECMFLGCSSLTTIDVGSFDTSNVTSMTSMFNGCSGLTTIDVSNFNTSKVTSLSGMFKKCNSLTELDVSNFNTSNVTSMSVMFDSCTNLINLNLYNFNTSKVVNMYGMFYECSNLIGLNIRNFNTSNVTDMRNMFYKCGSLISLDLKSFVISNDTLINNMFYNNNSLKTLYLKNKTMYDIIYDKFFFNGVNIIYTYSIEKAPVVKVSQANNNSLKLSWNKEENATKFEVYRSTNKTSGFKLIKTVTTNSYTDTGLTYGKIYYYKVKAIGINSKTSSVVNGKPLPNKVNLSIKSAGTTNIKLKWDKVSTTGYVVYRSTDNKKWTKISTITKNTTIEYNNTKLTSNKKYYYKVRAYKTVSGTKIYGPYSSVVNTKTAPVKPTLKLTIKNYQNINIKVGSVKGASKYQIYKSLDGKTYTKVKDLTSILTTYDGVNTIGKTYYYRVRACNSQNRCSGWVISKLKQTTKTPSFTLSSTKTKTITTTINGVDHADGYEVYRSGYKNGTYALVKSLTSSSSLKFNNGSQAGKTYYYKVRSYSLVNGNKIYSPYSGIKSIKSK